MFSGLVGGSGSRRRCCGNARPPAAGPGTIELFPGQDLDDPDPLAQRAVRRLGMLFQHGALFRRCRSSTTSPFPTRTQMPRRGVRSSSSISSSPWSNSNPPRPPDASRTFRGHGQAASPSPEPSPSNPNCCSSTNRRRLDPDRSDNFVRLHSNCSGVGLFRGHGHPTISIPWPACVEQGGGADRSAHRCLGAAPRYREASITLHPPISSAANADSRGIATGAQLMENKSRCFPRRPLRHPLLGLAAVAPHLVRRQEGNHPRLPGGDAAERQRTQSPGPGPLPRHPASAGRRHRPRPGRRANILITIQVPQ